MNSSPIHVDPQKPLCYNQIWTKIVVAEKSHALEIWKTMSLKRKIWMQAPCQFKADSSEAVRREKNSVCDTHAQVKSLKADGTWWSSARCELPLHRENNSGKEEVERTKTEWPRKIPRLNNLDFYPDINSFFVKWMKLIINYRTYKRLTNKTKEK